ncbi:MAG: hypothetical protein RL685_7473 [Pseudomonadota bacterium]
MKDVRAKGAVHNAGFVEPRDWSWPTGTPEVDPTAGLEADPPASFFTQVVEEDKHMRQRPIASETGKITRSLFVGSYRDAMCTLHATGQNQPVGCR